MNKKINSIQLLRAIAVILVIYNHSFIISRGNNFSDSLQSHFLNVRHWTSIGLDLFFVVSGVIMTIVTKSYLKKPDGWFEFLLKRMVRILPLYWLLSIVVYFERYAIHHPVTHGEIAKTILFFPVFAARDALLPIIGQGWSLSLEIYFYLIIVIALVFKPKQLFRPLIVTLIILGVVGCFIDPKSVLIKFLCTPILFEFAFGVAVGIGYQYFMARYDQKKLSTVKILSVTATIIGLALMLASLLYDSDGISSPAIILTDNGMALARSLIWGLPCSIFVFGLMFMEQAFELTIPVIWIKIGDASFSGYLIHMLVILTVGKLYPKFGLNNGDIFVIIATLFSIAVSLPVYQYLEKPLLNITNKLVFKPTTKKTQATVTI
ncbi:MAG: acyltransferase [Mucilaginibacter sp.]|uniref:acyltransferase family protein n=1 Tax=Mucilaginibacter sp. TaxID=1882438 RepID=UPI00326493C6